MALTSQQCAQFNTYLGNRPFPWDKRISKDRKPHSYIYLGMYKTSKWTPFTETNHLHEKVYVTRANDPGMWNQFFADPCLGTPCDNQVSYISHGVDQLSYGRYRKDYQTAVFCLDQMNTIEEVIAKMEAVVEGYKDVPEEVSGGFLRQLGLRTAGLASQGAGLWLVGIQDAYGNPAHIDVTDSMFALGSGGNAGVSAPCLFINLNANGQLSALAAAGQINAATTAGLVPFMSQLTMEYLGNHQEDLAAQGYHDRDWSVSGKFNITMDATTQRKLLVANPELRGLYKASDFEKGGAFYSYGVKAGCGDWMFKPDDEQWRFQFRGDLDGLALGTGTQAGAVWIQQVFTYENVAATFGLKPQYSLAWKAAPLAIYHCYNRDAREVFVGDITSVNSDMKFGLARSFMGKWQWHSPEYFSAFDPSTGSMCNFNNPKRNKGYFLGEYDFGVKTIYPEIERWFLALREPTPYTRRPNTVAPLQAPTSNTNYQQLVAYNQSCAAQNNNGTTWGQTAFAQAVADQPAVLNTQQGGSNFVGYTEGYYPYQTGIQAV